MKVIEVFFFSFFFNMITHLDERVSVDKILLLLLTFSFVYMQINLPATGTRQMKIESPIHNAPNNYNIIPAFFPRDTQTEKYINSKQGFYAEKNTQWWGGAEHRGGKKTK